MSLLEALQKVKANVSQKGRTYQVGSILSLLFIGYMCNINSVAGISRFGRRLTRSQLRKLRLPDGRSPCHSTILEILSRVDILDLDRCIREFSGSANDGQIINIDGKTLRSSKCMGKKALHILGAFCNDLLSSMGQELLSDADNEITAMPRLLEKLDIAGKILTGDAIFAQRSIVEKIVTSGGDFVLTVKNNQETLKRELEQAFEDTPDSKVQEYSEAPTKAHGRIEERSIKMIDMPWEYNNEWHHIKKIARITRCRHKKVRGQWKETEEEAYVITSLNSVTAKTLLSINRGHWSVENKIHWVRDVVLREDNCTVHKRSAAPVLTALRNLVISCIKKVSNAYTATRELYAHKPHLAFKLFLASG